MSAEADIRDTFESIIEIMKAGDADAVAEIWTDDAVTLPPGHPAVVGREAVEAWYRDFLGTYSIEYDHHSMEEIVVAGDLAYDRVEVRGRMVAKRCRDCSELIEFNNKAIHIWNRQADGTWLLARAVYNTNS